eukprot:s2972_g1.t2
MNFVLVKTFNFKPLAASAAGLARSFMCMVQPLLLKSKIKFLMDTGCGHDLISQTKVEKHDLETLVGQETVSFQAAISNFKTESFEEPINAYILDDTPSVLSIGKRQFQEMLLRKKRSRLALRTLQKIQNLMKFLEKKLLWKRKEAHPRHLEEESENYLNWTMSTRWKLKARELLFAKPKWAH